MVALRDKNKQLTTTRVHSGASIRSLQRLWINLGWLLLTFPAHVFDPSPIRLLVRAVLQAAQALTGSGGTKADYLSAGRALEQNRDWSAAIDAYLKVKCVGPT